LSPAQREFNRTVTKLDRLCDELEQWQGLKLAGEKKYREALEPVLQEINHLNEQWVLHFDRFYGRTGFSRLQKEKMAHFIRTQSRELISRFGYNQLKPLYDRYSAVDFDTGVEKAHELANDLARNMLACEFGIALDEGFDLNDPVMVERLQEKLGQQTEMAPEEQDSLHEKSALKQPAEGRQPVREADISQSLKSVYRQLTTTLHPDREPDRRERARKTLLMQQVTTAYRTGDLFKLLQLAVEQIDRQYINCLPAMRLQHFNTLLSRQLPALEDAVCRASRPLREMVGISSYASVKPDQILPLLDQAILEHRQRLRQLETELFGLDTVQKIKAWLADYPAPGPFDAPAFRF